MLEHLGSCPLKTFPLAEWSECKWGVCCRFAAIFERFICFWRFLMRERGVVPRSRSNSYAFVRGISVGQGLHWMRAGTHAWGSQPEHGAENGQRGVPRIHTWALPSHAEPLWPSFRPQAISSLPQQWSNEIRTIMVAMACTWANGVQRLPLTIKGKKK